MTLFHRCKRPLTVARATRLFEKVKREKHPDTKDLERLKDYHKVPVGTKEEMLALNLKYDAMVYQPTAIEKTMTPAQSYDAGNPLWARSYSIEQLSYYYMLESWPYTGQGIIYFMNGEGWRLSHHLTSSLG